MDGYPSSSSLIILYYEPPSIWPLTAEDIGGLDLILEKKITILLAIHICCCVYTQYKEEIAFSVKV
jgi:hypothetical protein